MRCNNCPRNCLTNHPFCNKPNDFKINIHQLHYGEEPPISGSQGSGTLFFSHCNLKCKFCQNYKISHQGQGIIVSDDELLDMCRDLKYAGAHNLNFVTPTPFIDKLIPILETLKKDTFSLPVVWNCGGYESLEMIKRLDGLVDIYLPDFKYSDDELAQRLSSAPNYKSIASQVIKEMRRQVKDIFDPADELMESGLIIRHLVLPSCLANSKGVLDAIKDSVGTDVYISLMSQYFPSFEAANDELINRTLQTTEYDEIVSYFDELGFGNGFIQGSDSATDEYVPDFI